MTDESVTRYNWDQVYDSNRESFPEALLRIKNSQQWRYIEHAIRAKYDNFQDLRSIEIGSGMGKASAILALMGADVTLVDNNDKALGSARELFSAIGCKGIFILADALSLPVDLWDRFEIALSIGTGEHFTGVNRKRVLESHHRALKADGSVFFVVPNALCLRYNVLMRLSASCGCSLEKEYPFRKKELLALARDIGFTGASVAGMNYKEATERFKIDSLIKDMANQHFPRWTRYYRKIIVNREDKKSQQNMRSIDLPACRDALVASSPRPVMSLCDASFGYALVLSGVK